MNETIDDIVREMRELGGKNYLMWSLRKYLNSFADRIETAAKHTCEYAIPNFGCASENRYLEENARLRELVEGLLETSSIECATCGYDCGPNRENCIIDQAAKFIEQKEET